MVFESYSKRFALVLDNGKRAHFLPGPDFVTDRSGDKIYFGRLDTASAGTQKVTGMDEASLDAALLASGSFKQGQAAVAGIWKREDRVAAESKLNKRASLTAAITDLEEDEIRQMLAFLKQEVPMNASKEALVALYVNAKYGPTEAAASTPAAPAGAATPEAPKAPKTVKVKKAKPE